MDDRFRARLEFVAGGTPSRFMMHEADWERLYRLVLYAASLDPGERPPEDELRAFLAAALPRREDWAAEVLTAYRHGLALLDFVRRESIGIPRP
jgi:hypothetical protein